MEEEEDWPYPIKTTAELAIIETSHFMEQPLSEPEINVYMHGTTMYVQKDEHLNNRFAIGSVSMMIAAASALALDFATAFLLCPCAIVFWYLSMIKMQEFY